MVYFDRVHITRATPREKVLQLAEGCNKCGHCCSYGTGLVLDDEIERIAKHLKMDRKEFKDNYLEETERFNTKVHRIRRDNEAKPYGRCVFLNQKKECLIHEVKPLHCMVGNCNEHGEQLSTWYTLNYLVNEHDPESIRQWAIYLKTHPTIPGGDLREIVKDEKKLTRIMNFEILK